MMRLSSVSFATALTDDEMGVKFDLAMIVEGEEVVGMLEKYFPVLVWKMREEESKGDEFGVWEEALVIVVNMELAVPKYVWREESLRMSGGICWRMTMDCGLIDGRGGKKITVALVQQKN